MKRNEESERYKSVNCRRAGDERSATRPSRRSRRAVWPPTPSAYAAASGEGRAASSACRRDTRPCVALTRDCSATLWFSTASSAAARSRCSAPLSSSAELGRGGVEWGGGAGAKRSRQQCLREAFPS